MALKGQVPFGKEMIYETIEVEQRGHVTHVLLNRPESMNAITPQMHEELQAAFDSFAEDDQYICVISGAGERAFCAGSDLKQSLVAVTVAILRMAMQV